MTITLRLAHNGQAVGAGQRCGDRQGRFWKVDNWSEGTFKVYARPAHDSTAPAAEFRPHELGLYIGHERGQAISEIKWGGETKANFAPPMTPEVIARVLASTRPLPSARAASIQWLSTVRTFSRVLQDGDRFFDAEAFVKACQDG